MIKQIFVNLPVKDLQKTMQFWKALGFSFNPQFTDDKAASLVLGDNMFAMLLTEPFFKGFIPGREIANAEQTKEVLTAMSLDSRQKVDEIVDKAVASGGKEYRPAEDHGWMYARSFEDPDGHVWEPVYTDLAKLGEANP